MLSRPFFPIYIVLILLIVGCGKKKNDGGAGDQAQVSNIIKSLNEENYEEALKEVENALKEDPSNPDIIYWKAQAQAGMANVDIYTLFPIVKMKLFEVALSDWGEADQYAERQKRYANTTVLGENSTNINIEKLKKSRKELVDLDIEEFSYFRSC